NVTIRDVTIDGTYFGIEAEHAYNLNIDNNTITPTHVGIELRSVERAVIERNGVVIGTPSFLTGNARNSITMKRSTVDDPRSVDITVRNNDFRMTGAVRSYVYAIHGTAVSDVRVVDNVVYANNGIGFLPERGSGGLYEYAPQRILIRGNIVDGGGAVYLPGDWVVGIRVHGAYDISGDTVIGRERATCAIKDNWVRRAGAYNGYAGSGGIVLGGASASSITGNHIEECGHHGITLMDWLTKCHISDNVVTDPYSTSVNGGSSNGTAGPAAIAGYGYQQDRITIHSNTIKRGALTPPSGGRKNDYGCYAPYGRESGRANYWFITAANNFDDTTKSRYYSRGPSNSDSAIWDARGLGGPTNTGL